MTELKGSREFNGGSVGVDCNYENINSSVRLGDVFGTLLDGYCLIRQKGSLRDGKPEKFHE